MHLLVHAPAPPLSRYVDHLWLLSDAPAHARERIFPSGTIELVINLVDDELGICSAPARSQALRRMPGAIVSGCYSAPFEFDTRAHARIMGAHFKPGAAAGFLGVPPGVLMDSHVALEDLWRHSALELRERLCTAQRPRELFRILEHALKQRLLLGHGGPRDAVAFAARALELPRSDVGQVTKTLGLSRRRLIQIFTEDVGMTPKRYARVRRFQRSLAVAETRPTLRWASVALECGYFDQAHLCREWAELTGLAPSQFIAARQHPVKSNHLALPDEGSNPSKTLA